MLCGKPVVAAKAGGAMELVEHGVNGFLATPGDSEELAQVINTCVTQKEMAATIANHATAMASQRFDIMVINRQIAELLSQRLKKPAHP
jgi:glycosyltransferase involved in cell wall biosynthesis